MPTAARSGNLAVWFSQLQRDYLKTGEEALLAEAADLGRMMAVTEVAADVLIETHSDVLADALADAPHQEAGRLVQAAGTVLSEMMLAFVSPRNA